MICPVGTPSLVRVVLVERRKVLLNPAAKVVVIKPTRINNGEPKPASMTRVVVVDVQDLPVHPLLSVFYVPNGLKGHPAILASSASAFPNQESDPFRDLSTLSGLLEPLSPPHG